MNRSCPISGDRRDEHAVRVVAAFVVLISVAAAIIGGTLGGAILIALGADFALRAAGKTEWSPLARVARAIVKLLPLAPKPVDAAPKRFAAKIGLVFSLAAGALFFGQAPLPATVIASILAFCAFLESAFAVCIGCKVYALLPRRIPQS